MDICFEGVGQVAATFQVSGDGVLPGMAVTLTDGGTVGLGSDGDAPCGVVLSGVRGGAAAVQIGGAVKVGYSGAAPAVGWQELVCDGEGGVKAAAKAAVKTVAEGGSQTAVDAAAGGVKFLVLAVDEDEKSVVVKL